MIVRNFLPICPNCNWCTRCVAMGSQLILAIGGLWFFKLHDDIGGIRTVFIEDDNISAFLFPAKVDGIFKCKPFSRVAVLIDKPGCIKLTDDFLRLKLNILITNDTFYKRGLLTSGGFDKDILVQGFNFIFREDRKMIIAVFEYRLDDIRSSSAWMASSLALRRSRSS